jgi:hypothetical protein
MASWKIDRAARFIQRQPEPGDAPWPAMDVPEGFYLGPYATATLTGQVGDLLAEAERKGAEGARAMLAEPEPRLREGQAVEYRSWATGPGRTPGSWTPAVFRDYGDQSNVTVTPLRGSGYVMSKTYEVRPVPAGVMTEARGWLADNQWADVDGDDIADMDDIDILRAIQHHYVFGWAMFQQNYGGES